MNQPAPQPATPDRPLRLTLGAALLGLLAGLTVLAVWRDSLHWSGGVALGLNAFAIGLLLLLRQQLLRQAKDAAAWRVSEARLRELNRDFEGFLENTSDFIYFKDQDGRFCFCSRPMARITGHAHWRQMIGKHDRDVFPPDTARIYAEEERAISREGAPLLNKVNPYYDENGAAGWVSTSKWPLFDDAGQVCGIFGMSRDVTAQKQAEDELRLAASVFANAQEGIIITDSNNRILDVNPAFCAISGYGRDEVLGKGPSLLSTERQDNAFYTEMWRDLQRHDRWQGEVWNRRKSGEVYAERLSISVIRDAAGAVVNYVGVFSDITPLKEYEAELRQIAHYDPLTGLPNRRLLDDRIPQALARARRSQRLLAVCYLDLDGFKPVNDKLGHDAGDLVLIKVAERLHATLRAEDTVARQGGDEFVLLLGGLEQESAYHAALERILSAVSRPMNIKGTQVSVYASIGVTLFPGDDADADTLLRHADQAMYRAKENGKNRYHRYDADRDCEIQAHRAKLERIAQALEDREFVLHYQPKVNLSSGEVTGVEALLRWQHPERGLLPPAEFLPLIQSTEFDLKLGRWVIDSALAQLAHWRTNGLALAVSVNVSADHLLSKAFVSELKQALEHHPGAPRGAFELEILETTAMDDLFGASRTLSECASLGVGFALDDFGTGYSSLSYFRRLPSGALKIDQEFVRGMLDDPEDLGIVESVIGLAQAFNRPVIAEGVETLEHAALLLLLGCTQAQGFGIGRPMPAAELAGWIERWQNNGHWRELRKPGRSREALILSVAASSHRRWVDKVAAVIEGKPGLNPPPLPSRHCRFGRWFHGSGFSRYGHLADYRRIDHLHEAIHGLAADLVAQAQAGETTKARHRLPGFFEQRDRLLAAIERMQEHTRGGAPD